MRQVMVALVGRPNVGKSALFNRLIGKHRAIVDEMPGLTRDRHFGLAEWQNRSFLLVDTGGVEAVAGEGLRAQVQAQTRQAIAEADALIWVVDGRVPLDAIDQRLAAQLRQAGKPVLVAVNKVDNEALEADAAACWSLGFETLVPVSALHGRRVDELLDALVAQLPQGAEAALDDTAVRLAVVGRPNVGKSSLVNAMLGQTRVLVSAEPGTTRDAVDAQFVYGDRTFHLVDTAGLRTPKRITAKVEQYAVARALRSIHECHVALLVLDATEPLTEQDERIAGLIHEAGRGCILVVNKWDAVAKDTRTTDATVRALRRRLRFLDYAPIITLSAKTGQRVDKLLALAVFVDEQHVMRVKTSLLNQTLRDILHRHPPPTRRGKPLRIRYIAQTGVRPPAFALFVNEAGRMHFTYLRHVRNGLRERFGLEGTPLILMLRGQKEARDA